MAQLILFNMITPEGYFESQDGSLHWHRTDSEFRAFALEQLQDCSSLLLGRKTFEMLRDYWTSQAAVNQDPAMAEIMSEKTKYVVSQTLQTEAWNSRCIGKNLLETLLELKSRPGNILLLGSASLANSLSELGLVDQYRLMVNPVLIGAGKPLFRKMENRLRLTECRAFGSGNVLLGYQLLEHPKYRTL